MSNKAKLLWRCRRGVKELDVVLTRYLESCYDAANAADKHAFECLLECQDPDILRYILRQEEPEDKEMLRIIEKIRG